MAASAAAGLCALRGSRAARFPRRRYRRRRRGADKARNHSLNRRRSCRSARRHRLHRSPLAGAALRCRTRREYRYIRIAPPFRPPPAARPRSICAGRGGKVAVFSGARLALIGVDDKIGGALALFGHKRPFEAGRKAGAAAPAQPRLLDLVDDPVTALGDQIFGAVPVAPLPGAGEAPIAAAIEIGENAVPVGEHQVLSAAALGSGVSVNVVRPVTGSEPWRPITEPGGGGRSAASASSSASVAGPSRSS